MNRRNLLQWTAPVIVGVTLPAHAATSEPIKPKPTTTPPPTTTKCPEEPEQKETPALAVQVIDPECPDD